MSNDTSAASNGFSGLGIAPTLLDILAKHQYSTPTPIQHQSIPVALNGSDIIGIAQTGTGKTLAFGIPMIQRLAQFKGRGLVILPTRELALQVEENLRKIGGGIGMRTVVLIGGASMHIQKQNLQKNPHVIIATPGRLIDHLEQKTIKLHEVNILVLDEADRMLDMGFAPQIAKILATVPKERQTMLFSATMPLEIVRIANTAMRTPVRVEVAPQGTLSERVEQELFFISKMDKERLLEQCLTETEGTVLVFSRTKHGAKKIARAVREMGHTADELHANRSLAQRKAALEGFKTGKYRVLVATDIAARGIDVKGIALVINYDLPDNPDDYVHRIGRTGRAGMTGKAVSFATPDQRGDVKGIERLIRTMIPLKQTPKNLPAPRRLPPMERDADPRDKFRTGGGKTYGAKPAYGSRPPYKNPGEKFYTNTAPTAAPYPAAAKPAYAPRASRPYSRPRPMSAAPSAPAAAQPSAGSNAFAFAPRKFKK
jgi:ATP-dependent RNA helicase RhlE